VDSVLLKISGTEDEFLIGKSQIRRATSLV
jgi:hypothetical protein